MFENNAGHRPFAVSITVGLVQGVCVVAAGPSEFVAVAASGEERGVGERGVGEGGVGEAAAGLEARSGGV